MLRRPPACSRENAGEGGCDFCIGLDARTWLPGIQKELVRRAVYSLRPNREALNSPMMPRRKTSTQTMKTTPVMIVTGKPVVAR
jgi:hypothetical protein